ncbi:hypothetical protein V496_03515, partial [Pseudogymnoascus sp. VKM F-4515 (FW-2607)]
LVPEFKSQMMKSFNNNRAAWRRREYEYLQYGHKIRERRKLSNLDLTTKASREIIDKSVTPLYTIPKVSTTVTQEDTIFDTLPSYSPCPSPEKTSLPHVSFNLKQQAFDLSKDPNNDLLHQDAVYLALKSGTGVSLPASVQYQCQQSLKTLGGTY